MNFFSKIILYFLSIPKTIYINFKYFSPRQAIKFPILISYKVKLINVKGNIKIETPIKFAQIRIGFANYNNNKVYSSFDLRGNLIFKNTASFANGIKLLVAGELCIGDNFVVSGTNVQINCGLKMSFGDNTLIGWDCFFTDSDGHKILNSDNKQINNEKEVSIGNHVWICKGVSIFKGSVIGNNSVVAANSTVLGEHNKDNCIIGGYPAQILKENINWDR